MTPSLVAPARSRRNTPELSPGLRSSLHALETARSLIEVQYLGGETALFADALTDWAEQVHRSEEMAVMALRMAELDGARPLDEARSGVSDDARVAACVADVVEPGKSKALDELGDGGAAIRVALRWLGPWLKAGSESATL